MNTKKKTTPDDNVIANNIKAYRIARNVTQNTLAGHLGISFQQIQKYEKGINRVSASALLKISECLSVHPMALLGENKNQETLNTATDKDVMELLSIYGKIKDENVKIGLKTFLKSYVRKHEKP